MNKILLSKKNISFFCFLFINFIFGAKYFSRFSGWYFVICLFLTMTHIIVFRSNSKIDLFKKHLQTANLLMLLFFVICFYFLFKRIPVETLNIDRWSVITTFWDNYFNNKYVYFAKSCDGNYPGPMPFYFILALPFYLIDELGYFSLLGLISFFLLLKINKINLSLVTVLILLIMGSVFYFHEVLGRSNIFLNSTIVLLVLNHHFRRIESNQYTLIYSGILVGLSISTRNVLVIPFIIAFAYQLKNKLINLKQIFILSAITLATFTITFLPFVWNHIDDFFIMNPFVIQSTALIPFKYSIFFIGLAFIFGFYVKNENEVYFYSGMNLIVIISIYFIYNFSLVGFNETFFKSYADITYFILCVPFFLFFLAVDTN